MDFELSNEQKDVQKAAREFAQGEFDPDLVLELDRKGKFPESIWKKAAQLGFIGIHYPEEFGGQGLGFFENLLVIEAFCRVDSGIGSALSSVDLGSEVILKFGSHEQKNQFLTPLTKGERRLGIAFGESEDSRDLTAISTIAERKRDGYSIHGKKSFVLNASLADSFITLCKEPREGWITLMIEREKDGIEVHLIEKIGWRMIPFGDLLFKEVPVPTGNRIGREGEGMAHVNHCYQAIGLKSAAQALGTAQGAFDRAMQYAKQREQFGKKLSQFQVIRHKLADMAVSIEVARWLVYKAATEYDQKKIDPGFLSIAQLEVGRKLISVVDEALQIFGGYGYIAEEAIEHYFRDAWAIGVELGTEEELKDLIAEIMLGHSSVKH
ncbi:MAG: acyl-CoA/acyl-ACP dehydrogenase [Desulfobacterales bacterium]|nr:acyl-CoA/acyl-ACP dehydrogenase [Desulfobacterales bacterium]